jgi:2-polyprenyl-3-methyl-5-hydroxy-6-metoxy-1,4-benzoquinol methylase
MPTEEMLSRALAATDYHRFPGGRKKIAALLDEVSRLGERAPRVLDVGCGNGSLSFPLAAIGCDVVGVDVDQDSLANCRARAPRGSPRFVWSQGDLEELAGEFDLVVCSEVLEHLDDPAPLVRAMARKLAPRGTLFVTVPNGWGLREIGGRCEHFLRERCGLDAWIRGLRDRLARFGMASEREKYRMHTANPEQGHVQKFTRRSLTRLLEAAGLEISGWTNSFVILTVFRCRGGESGVERLDSRAADHLPAAFASGWYVTCRRRAPAAREGAVAAL